MVDASILTFLTAIALLMTLGTAYRTIYFWKVRRHAKRVEALRSAWDKEYERDRAS